MKEFISILISFIFMSLADSIDSAFNNLISIDAIVVTGSFLLIDSIFKSFAEIGIYTYKSVLKIFLLILCFIFLSPYIFL